MVGSLRTNLTLPVVRIIHIHFPWLLSLVLFPEVRQMEYTLMKKVAALGRSVVLSTEKEEPRSEPLPCHSGSIHPGSQLPNTTPFLLALDPVSFSTRSAIFRVVWLWTCAFLGDAGSV